MPALMIDPAVFELRRMAQGLDPLIDAGWPVIVAGVLGVVFLAVLVAGVVVSVARSRVPRGRHAGSRPVESDGFEETYDRIVSADEAAQVAQARAQAEAELQLLDFLGSVEDLAPGQREQIEALRAKYLAVLDA